jgi:hypothetical protein
LGKLHPPRILQRRIRVQRGRSNHIIFWRDKSIEAWLEEWRCYLLQNEVVFSVDMGRYNILLQKLSLEPARLVVIDGLGNHTAINWLDNIGFFARRKIQCRRRRFIDRPGHYSAETMRLHDTDPLALEAAYRRSNSHLMTMLNR